MPEIKNTFVRGRMNKDLDERLVPRGEYRHAMNIQVGTSEGSDVGTVQNILGNLSVENIVPSNCKCVGAIADEKNNKLYWFIRREFRPDHINLHAIIEYSPEFGVVPVIVDTKIGTPDAVLKFPDKIITGINIIDNLLFWTDGVNEPRKININQCKDGTPLDALATGTHTQLSHELGSFSGYGIDIVANNQDDLGSWLGDMYTTIDDPSINHGKYFYFQKNQLSEVLGNDLSNAQSGAPDGQWNVTMRHYRDSVFLGVKGIKIFTLDSNGDSQMDWGYFARLSDAEIAGVSDADQNRSWYTGDILFADPNTIAVGTNSTRDITEDHITVMKQAPKNSLNVKINTTDNPSADPIFEKLFPRFSYRYKYADNQYSTFAPFTQVVFNPEHKPNYSLDNAYDVKEPYNTSMLNTIDSIELTDFVSPDLKEDVEQIDILYKQENSPIIYSIASLTRTDAEWHFPGSNGFQDIGIAASVGEKPQIEGGLIKGKYTVKTENINAALPENQLLRPWDNVPRKAIAQEITGNRIVYGNYVQGYTPETTIPYLLADYKPRIRDYSLPSYSFNDRALPSVKSQRNYQLGVVFGDKYGRETPVFTSNKSAIKVPWKNSEGILSATQSYQIEAKLEKDPPSFAEYIKYFIKETSGEYYNLIMEKAYIPADISEEEMKHHLWLSFPSSERNKVSVDDYLILKKKIGAGQSQVQEKNRFKILDIKNEAPPAVKYEYSSLGSADQATDGGTTFLNTSLFPTANFRPTLGVTQLRLDASSWEDNCDGASLGADDTSEREYLKGNMYISWSRIAGTQVGVYSSKYRILDSYLDANSRWRLTLEKPISSRDADISAKSGTPTDLNEDLAIKIEQRREKNLELFSGKFFVKVVSSPILYGNILDDTALLNKYVWTAKQDIYWLADARATGTTNMGAGILNAQSYTPPTGGTNSPEELHSGTVSSYRSQLENIYNSVNATTPFFFIDNLYMVAGQISDNNYAKNAGQIWNGIQTSYPPNPTWVGNSEEDGAINDEISNTSGWRHFNKMAPTYNDDGAANGVNGLEGIIETDTNHVGTRGIRRWKREFSTGAGLHRSELSFDNTYGKEDDTGKFYMHISFFAPGEDLIHSTLDMGDELFGDNSIAQGLQGIWGGGVFTKADGSLFGAGSADEDKHRVVPMEGIFPIGGVNDKPGPDVDNSFGYDESYRHRHENQWNPAWPSDLGGVIQEFIDNLEPGKQFKFEGDTSNTIYTIKRKSIKKIYNYRGWRRYVHHDGTSFVDDIGQASVEREVIAWADTLDQDGLNGDAIKLNEAKAAIQDFGRAYNRRVTYILELDKNPRDSAVYNPMDGSNIDLDTAGTIQFVSQASSFVELDSEKPIIWETEPKESVDLEIYHEASGIIPTKITSKTNELFAPVGCRVKNLGISDHMPSSWMQDNYDHENVLVQWTGENEFELSPGFKYLDANDDEADYSNVKLRFYRPDGSYTTGLLSAQAPDPGNSQGNPPGDTGGFKTKFIISPIVESNLETGLNWYNCFSFGNGIESNRIRDGYNEMQITNGPVVSSTIDTTYKEEHRVGGLIYSGIYNADASVNNLNQFIMAEKITKDLNPTYGSIQKLFQRRVGLVAFCEDRVVDIMAGKDTLFNADGNPQLVASNRVLGTATPFVGDFGISKNPESFASESYRAYFTDKQRGAVLRLSMDGLTPISDIGMRDWFRDNLITPNELIGTYDEYKKEYNLTLSQKFTENLLRNSDISEGERLINLIPVPSNVIDNGGLENGTNITLPDIWNTGTTSSVYNLHDGFLGDGTDAGSNIKFPITTTITNHPVIPVGYFQPAVSAQTFIADNDSTYITSTHTILNDSYGGFGSTYTNWTNTGGPFNPYGSSTASSGYAYARVLNNGPIHQWDNTATYFPDDQPGSPSGPAGFHDQNNSTSSNTYYGYSSYYPDYIGSRHVYGLFGNNYSGIFFHRCDETHYPLIPWSHNSGAIPTNHVETNVKTWGPGNPNRPNTATTNYLSSTNLTMFSGEEIKVTFTLTGVSTVTPRIRLFDNGVQVADSKIYRPDQGSPGNSYPDYDDEYPTSVASYGTTDVYDNIWKATHAVPTGGPDNSWPYATSAYERGYQNTADFIFSGTVGSTDTETYVCYFKFKKSSESGNNHTEGVVVSKLSVAISTSLAEQSWAYNGHWFTLSNIKIEKVFSFHTPENPGQTGIIGEVAIPATAVQEWAEVQHQLVNPSSSSNVNWSLTTDNLGFNPEIYPAWNAVQTYGMNNPTTTAQATSAAGITYSWNVPNSNGVTTYNQYTSGFTSFTEYTSSFNSDINATTWTSTPTNDDIYIDSATGGASVGIITSGEEIDILKTADKWVMIDVITQDASFGVFTGGSTTVQKYINAMRLLDPNCGTASFGGWDSLTWYGSNIDYGSFGSFSSTTNQNQGADRGMLMLDVADWPNDIEWHGSDLVNIDSQGYYPGGIPANCNLLRAIVKVHPNSYNVQNNEGYLRLRLYDFIGKVKMVNVRDISDIITGGQTNSWSYEPGYSWSNAVDSWDPEHYGDHDDALVVNSLSTRKLYYENGKIRFVNASAPGQVLQQKFDIDPIVPFNLLRVADNYEFRITISNYISGVLRIQIRGYYDNVTPWNGVVMEIDGNGTYTAKFNVNGDDGNVMDLISFEKDGNPYNGSFTLASDDGNWVTYNTDASIANCIRIHNKRHHPAASVVPFTGDISNMFLFDSSSIIMGGSVDYWEFTGFDLQQASYAYFDNGEIKFENAPNIVEVRQVINKQIKEGESYRIRFNYNITDGVVQVYYFNNLGKGFRTSIINDSGGGAVGYYDAVHTVGSQTLNDNFSGELTNTFVITLRDSGVIPGSSAVVNGTLDNFSMQREFLNFEPKTLTFSEELKGWVSFKSFIPENGVSVAKQYYTMNNGHLFQHHTNETRNQFYNQAYHDITESSILTIINADPSLVKTFNTLGYEGTQSRVLEAQHPDHFTFNNHNDKAGWYCEEIRTDKQEGTLKEFVEKEGKWFNYIRGKQGVIDTGEFSFQGLGVTTAVNVINAGEEMAEGIATPPGNTTPGGTTGGTY